MTYFETVELVKSKINTMPGIDEHFAVQINIEGEGEGIFYIEVKENQVFVEPYDYVDRDVLVTTTAKDFISFIEGAEITLNTEGTQEKVTLLKKLVAEPVVEEKAVEEEKVEEAPVVEEKTVEKTVKKPAKKSTKGKKARKATKKKK